MKFLCRSRCVTFVAVCVLQGCGSAAQPAVGRPGQDSGARHARPEAGGLLPAEEAAAVTG